MKWWQIALLCYGFYVLGGINAVVAERERFTIWMSNSWEIINRRLWWIGMLDKPLDEDSSVEVVAELAHNMIKTLDDYNTVFGRPYTLEDLLESEVAEEKSDV